MKKSLLVLISVLMLTGCSSSAQETTAPAPAPTEPETSLVARENILQETSEDETQETEPETTAEDDAGKFKDVNGRYPVTPFDFKEFYKNIKASEYAKYKDAIIVDQVIPNNVTSDYGEQIPIWDFNYAEYALPGLESVYEQVPEIARDYATEGVDTCLSIYCNGNNNIPGMQVTYAAIDNAPGKGWDKSVVFSIENPNDIKDAHLLLVIFINEQDRAVRVALFDTRDYMQSDLSEYNGYKGPTMTLNPDTNESFDVIGTMPLGDASYLNRIKEK